jgi:hypothetical protein
MLRKLIKNMGTQCTECSTQCTECSTQCTECSTQCTECSTRWRFLLLRNRGVNIPLHQLQAMTLAASYVLVTEGGRTVTR